MWRSVKDDTFKGDFFNKFKRPHMQILFNMPITIETRIYKDLFVLK